VYNTRMADLDEAQAPLKNWVG